MQQNHSYRPEIDGLRAIAVLSVVGYHLFPNALSGGLFGVDVFFVISGYLISGILLKELNEGRFSFSQFYKRRVRRIFPALILVLVSCLGIGWFLLSPNEYRELGSHVLSGAGFSANLALFSERGFYFAPEAEQNPLLHLWSLGIEEQFYIFWPVALVALYRLPGKFKWLCPSVIFCLVLLSFGLNFIFDRNVPLASFYLPLPRAWELLAGCLLASLGPNHFTQSKVFSETMTAMGLALIAFGVFWLEVKPELGLGLYALAPVSGSFLVLLSGSSSWLGRKLLSHPVAVFFGLISYPLYLWHWPLLSLAKIILWQDLGSVEKAAI